MFKTLALIALPVAAFSAFNSSASEFPRPELVRIVADRVFTPSGFDDNDNAQLVVHGSLINTCYKAAPPKVTVDEASRKILVEPQAYAYSSSWCLNVLVPYTQTVDLGILTTGIYQVVEMDMEGKFKSKGTLPVSHSRGPSPDDTLYAPVKNAYLDRKGPKPELVLTGVLASDCMYLEQVKTVQKAPGVIEVLPQAGYKQGTICQGTPRPFEVRVAVPAGESGDTLFHVRSLNGQSVNTVETL